MVNKKCIAAVLFFHASPTALRVHLNVCNEASTPVNPWCWTALYLRTHSFRVSTKWFQQLVICSETGDLCYFLIAGCLFQGSSAKPC